MVLFVWYFFRLVMQNTVTRYAGRVIICIIIFYLNLNYHQIKYTKQEHILLRIHFRQIVFLYTMTWKLTSPFLYGDTKN